MKILGIDSSGLVASAAVIDGDTVLAEFTVNNKRTHSQTLLPMIERVISMAELRVEELDAIAIASGPGSFTGLRIGSSTAKGIGFVTGKPLIPVPTLEGLAYRVAVTDRLICPMMDARRDQVYTGLYRKKDDGLKIVQEQEAVSIGEIVERINTLGEPVLFLGDGVPVQEAYIREHTAVSFEIAPMHLNRQSAASVAALGKIYFLEGKTESAAEHKPVYLRKSQAEREREHA